MRVMNLDRRLRGRRHRYPAVEALEPRALLAVGLLVPSFGNAGTADILLSPDVAASILTFNPQDRVLQARVGSDNEDRTLGRGAAIPHGQHHAAPR